MEKLITRYRKEKKAGKLFTQTFGMWLTMDQVAKLPTMSMEQYGYMVALFDNLYQELENQKPPKKQTMTPKLKQAISEIKDILEKYDVGAAIALHTEPKGGTDIGYGEFLFHLTPSYSCIYIEDDQLRIRSKRTDYESEEHQIKHINDTANMVLVLKELLANNFANLELLEQTMSKHFDITSTPGRFKYPPKKPKR